MLFVPVSLATPWPMSRRSDPATRSTEQIANYQSKRQLHRWPLLRRSSAGVIVWAHWIGPAGACTERVAIVPSLHSGRWALAGFTVRS